MKIINRKKFVRALLMLILVNLGILFIFDNNVILSHTELQYKTVYIDEGDTLWSIAKNELTSNIYYKNKDIREIICNIKSINNIKDSNLYIGQKLLIPEI